jgi:16S rRNA (guanine1207-N2)-methyltransferase
MILPDDDGSLAALEWGFRTEALPALHGSVLFLNARHGALLASRADIDWHCEQGFLPWNEALRCGGFEAQARIEATGFDACLILLPPQRDEARALLARATVACREGAWLIAVAPNRAGGGSVATDLDALMGRSQSTTKHKCRMAWASVASAQLDAELQSNWLALDAPRPIALENARFWTRPGLFAWDRIDPASALLASQWPTDLAGRVADLGAGWGYLSVQLLRHCPAIRKIDLFEANARALEPARRNLDAALVARSQTSARVHWHDVAQGLPGRFDVIVSNPPFHVGASEQVDLGRAFIRSARTALGTHGVFWLVANRHLPYEASLAEHFQQVDTMIQHEGFKVIRARGPRP